MSFADSLLKQLATGDSIHDYQHASKIFVSNNYRLAPKQSFLFYVKIVINQDVGSGFRQVNDSDIVLIGATAKTANLPKFSIENKTYNAYNRPNIVQSKLKYEPVTIKFHDDSSGLVRAFWYDYLSYYYRDTDYADAIYAGVHKYEPRQREGWGYNLKPDAVAPTVNTYNTPTNFIRSISIYSMSQKTYSEYQLINPIITQFQHGEHDMSNGSGTMEHTMTFNYETLHYRKGNVTDNTMHEMLLLYDQAASPLTAAGGGTRSFLGPGGFFASMNDIGQDLADGNFASAALIAARSASNFNKVDLGQLAAVEGTQALTNIINGAANPFAAVTAPTGLSTTVLSSYLATAAVVGTTNGGAQQGVDNTTTPVGGTKSSATYVGQGLDSTNTALVTSGGTAISNPTNTIPTTEAPAFPPVPGTVQYGVGGVGVFVPVIPLANANTTSASTTTSNGVPVGSTVQTMNSSIS